jgi:hypothetical protein
LQVPKALKVEKAAILAAFSMCFKVPNYLLFLWASAIAARSFGEKYSMGL